LSEGYEVHFIFDENRGTTDEEIIQKAANED